MTPAPVMVIARDLAPLAAALLLAQIDEAQRSDLDRGDFFDHVREEIEVSRERTPDLLMPHKALIEAAHKLGDAVRAARLGDHRCEIKQRAAELAALAVRLAVEGTPAFPYSMPGGGR